jgi:hypothetical protein
VGIRTFSAQRLLPVERENQILQKEWCEPDIHRIIFASSFPDPV